MSTAFPVARLKFNIGQYEFAINVPTVHGDFKTQEDCDRFVYNKLLKEIVPTLLEKLKNTPSQSPAAADHISALTNIDFTIDSIKDMRPPNNEATNASLPMF